MKRTTIFIPEELEADLQHYARQAKKLAAWVVREALTSYLSTRTQPVPRSSAIGMGDSGRSDVSERFESLLFADRAPGSSPKSANRATSRSPRRGGKPAR